MNSMKMLRNKSANSVGYNGSKILSTCNINITHGEHPKHEYLFN